MIPEGTYIKVGRYSYAKNKRKMDSIINEIEVIAKAELKEAILTVLESTSNEEIITKAEDQAYEQESTSTQLSEIDLETIAETATEEARKLGEKKKSVETGEVSKTTAAQTMLEDTNLQVADGENPTQDAKTLSTENKTKVISITPINTDTEPSLAATESYKEIESWDQFNELALEDYTKVFKGQHTAKVGEIIVEIKTYLLKMAKLARSVDGKWLETKNLKATVICHDETFNAVMGLKEEDSDKACTNAEITTYISKLINSDKFIKVAKAA